ncbi:MAG: hypothetical protein QOH04_361 [Sphingomonadales bacterium]|jgi:hypothetical protein|nr:hypothetical protein [Sphingomonadales bacterium]
MSHDLEASYAAAEVAAEWLRHPEHCFQTIPPSQQFSAYAAREGRNSWPHADGVIELGIAGGESYSVALEFKRPNEGVHGVLTAIGQAHAYLRKGYAGSVIVIPAEYAALGQSGQYVREVLDLTSKAQAIGVYAYQPPDLAKPSPFAGRLQLSRPLKVDAAPPVVAPVQLGRTETQWAHVREGSTDPDALFRYLQAVKLLSGGHAAEVPWIPAPLADAVERLRPGAVPANYISSAPGSGLSDHAWRSFWFEHVLHADAISGWVHNGIEFEANGVSSTIMRSDGRARKLFFVGKSNSIKDKLVGGLNRGKLSEQDAWDALADNYHGRAHSYREDIDSGAEHLGFISSDGRLTDYGYRFVDACERTGDANTGLPRALFMNAVLREGGLGAFLHYVYRLSEEAFQRDPLAFTVEEGGRLTIDSAAYLRWVEGEMANRLHVIRKVSIRGGIARRPFQAELAVLRNLGIVSRKFRFGVGLVVNWPALQGALEFDGSFDRLH